MRHVNRVGVGPVGMGEWELVTPFYKPLAVCSGKVLAFIKYNISVLSECYRNPLLIIKTPIGVTLNPRPLPSLHVCQDPSMPITFLNEKV